MLPPPKKPFLTYIFFLGLLFYFFVFTKTVFALSLEEACTYPERRDTGIYECRGKGKLSNPGPDTGTITCQFDVSIDPDCKLVETAKTSTPGSAAGSSATQNTTSYSGSAVGSSVTSDNWHAEEQSAFTITNLEFGMMCELTKVSTIPNRNCPARKAADGKLTLYKDGLDGGAFGSLVSVMGNLYDHPPLSSTLYLAHLGENIGLVQPVYAQVGGSGASILKPVLQMWQVTRNIAYMGFILIFITVGFMIMFRRKLNQNTVISVQAALPGLVVGLILVTFSYFIAALLVDTSFVGMKLATEIFISTRAPNYFGDDNGLRALVDKSSLFSLFSSAALNPANVTEITSFTFTTITKSANGAFQAIVPSQFIRALITIAYLPQLILGTAAVGIGSAIVGILVSLVLIIALMIQFFRLLFALIKSYIQILLMTLAGPFIILYASLPGNGANMAFWWKTILGNALIFPAVFSVFLLAGMILVDNSNWTTNPPLFGGTPTSMLKLMIAYGLMLGSPAIPDMVRGAFKVDFPAKYANEAMKSAAVSGKMGKTVGGFGYNKLWRGHAVAGGAPQGYLANQYTNARANMQGYLARRYPTANARIMRWLPNLRTP